MRFPCRPSSDRIQQIRDQHARMFMGSTVELLLNEIDSLERELKDLQDAVLGAAEASEKFLKVVRGDA